MNHPSDLEFFSPRVEDAAGWLRVPGLGHVETGFVCLGRFPLVPVQSTLVLSNSRGEITLPRLVPRSVLLAVMRRWGGLLALLAALLVLALVNEGGRHLSIEVVLYLVPILAFALSWWPLGRASHRLATAIAQSARLPTHDVDRAFGRIDAEQHALAEQQWQQRQVQATAERRENYQAGLRARREAQQPRRARGRS